MTDINDNKNDKEVATSNSWQPRTLVLGLINQVFDKKQRYEPKESELWPLLLIWFKLLAVVMATSRQQSMRC